MKLEVEREQVWVTAVPNRPGTLHEKLKVLAEAGANLGFVIARRSDRSADESVVFVTPLTGSKQTKAGEAAGFRKTENMHGVRVSGADKAGVGATLTGALGEAGLNLRGLSAAAIGSKMVMHLAFDSEEDAKRAVTTLKKLK
jgi:hypothetical protein